MAETPWMPLADDASRYWCYRCDKQVCIETLSDLTDIVCRECRGGFVESVADLGLSMDTSDEQFHLMLSNSLPQDVSMGFDPDERMDDEVADEAENGDGDDGSDEDSTDWERRLQIRERFREVIVMQMREIASRSVRGVIDWEDVSGIFDGESMQAQFRAIFDRYMDARGISLDEDRLEFLLRRLAEIDGGGRRGAPPAARMAVESLETLEIEAGVGDLVCAVCKDALDVGDTGKKLPCGHVYHGGCIVPWLNSRNSCPVCRFELPTDDRAYEEEKKKRVIVSEGTSGSGGDNWAAME